MAADGEKKKTWRNSPVIGDGGITASPADIERLTKQALAAFVAGGTESVDLHNVESVYNAIIAYFQTCLNNHTRPGNLGLYAALGLSRQDYNNLISGRVKGKASPACIDIIKRAAREIGAYREGLALEGKLHPTTYIFMGKNYDSMEDSTRIEISPDPSYTARMTPDEIQKAIEKDIPIDIDSE